MRTEYVDKMETGGGLCISKCHISISREKGGGGGGMTPNLLGACAGKMFVLMYVNAVLLNCRNGAAGSMIDIVWSIHPAYYSRQRTLPQR